MMISKYLSLFITLSLSLFQTQICCQSINDLKSTFLNSKEDTTYLLTGYKLAKLYEKENLDSALYFINQVIEKSRNPVDNIDKFLNRKGYLFYLQKGNILNQYNKFDEAKIFFEEAKKFAYQANDRIALIYTYAGLGSALAGMHDDSTIIVLEKTLELIDTTQGIKDHNLFVITNYDISRVLSQSGKYSEAINILIALLKYPEQGVISPHRTSILNQIAILLKRSLDYEGARKYYLMGLEDNSIPAHHKALFLYNLANLYYQWDKLDSASFYTNRILNLENLSPHYSFKANKLLADIRFEESDLISSKKYLRKASLALPHLKNINLHTDYFSSEVSMQLYEGNFNEALISLNKLDSLFKLSSLSVEVLELAFLKEKELIARLGIVEEDSIISLFEDYIAIRDSLESIRVDEQIQETKTKYETEKKEKEIITLKYDKSQAELAKQKYLVIALSLLVPIFLLCYYYVQGRKKNRVMRKNAELLEDKYNILEEGNEGLQKRIEELEEVTFKEKIDSLLPHYYELGNIQKTALQLADISYLESMKDKTIFHTVDGKVFNVWLALSKHLEQLPKDIFLLVHKSYAVNLTLVQETPPRKIRLKNGVEIPVGPTFKAKVIIRIQEFREAFKG